MMLGCDLNGNGSCGLEDLAILMGALTMIIVAFFSFPVVQALRARVDLQESRIKDLEQAKEAADETIKVLREQVTQVAAVNELRGFMASAVSGMHASVEKNESEHQEQTRILREIVRNSGLQTEVLRAMADGFGLKIKDARA